MSELERQMICQRVKQARVEAGLTQEELADLLNVGQRTVANYESVRVPWRYLAKIGEVTGRTQEWLLRGDADAEPADDLAALAKAVEQLAEQFDLWRDEVRESHKEQTALLAELRLARKRA